MPQVMVDIDALRDVLDYLWDDEKRHYEEMKAEAPGCKGVKFHMFHTLCKLKKALPKEPRRR